MSLMNFISKKTLINNEEIVNHIFYKINFVNSVNSGFHFVRWWAMKRKFQKLFIYKKKKFISFVASYNELMFRSNVTNFE